MHEYASDPVVTRYLWWGPNGEEDTQRFLALATDQASERPRQNFELAIVHRESGELFGGCGLTIRRAAYREYEIGYCLNKEWWDHGYGAEAVRALIDFGFRKLAAHRIFAVVDPENSVSAKLLCKLRFRQEGVQRKDTLIAGRWRDTSVYALIDEEWTA